MHACRYFITCTDYFTQWPEAGALPSNEAGGIATFLYSLFCRHGIPKRVQSDQGREFVNSLNEKLFECTVVQHIISTAELKITVGHRTFSVHIA